MIMQKKFMDQLPVKNILLLNYGVTFRLKSKGPACLLKVSPRKTLLDKQITIINKVFPNSNIIVVSNFKNKKIKTYPKNVNLIENKFSEETNCLYSIALAMQNLEINDSLFIIPGNIYLKSNLFNKFDKSISQLWLTKQYQELGCIVNENKIQHVMWTLQSYWSNIGFFTGKELNLLKHIINTQDDIEKLFLFEAINKIVDSGGEFKAVTKKNKIKFINKISDL